MSLKGAPDKSLPTCPVCGYRCTLQWARFVWRIAKRSEEINGFIPMGVIARCEECSTAGNPVVIPYVFMGIELDEPKPLERALFGNDENGAA